MQHQRPHHAAIRPEHRFEDFGDAISHAASDAKYRVKERQFQAQQVVREHPLLSVGVALGGGVLLGAVGHRLLEHQQTLGEALAERLGVNRLRSRVRRLI